MKTVKAKIIDGPHVGHVLKVDSRRRVVTMTFTPPASSLMYDENADSSTPVAYNTFDYYLLPVFNGRQIDHFVLSHRYSSAGELNHYLQERHRALLTALKQALRRQAIDNNDYYDDLAHGETILDGHFELDQVANALLNLDTSPEG